MEVYDSKSMEKVVNNADFVLPDGKPIYWMLKLLGYKKANHIRGMDLMSELCKISNERSYRVGFYGGSSSALLKKTINNLKDFFPKLKVTYKFSPPFRPLSNDERKKVLNEINDSKVDILFVGIGCPKQEIWMNANKNQLSCTMLGVGAAFDFHAGEKLIAPIFIQKIGFEWLFRFCCEPRRLWKRYLKHNPRFLILAIKQLLLERLR